MLREEALNSPNKLVDTGETLIDATNVECLEETAPVLNHARKPRPEETGTTCL